MKTNNAFWRGKVFFRAAALLIFLGPVVLGTGTALTDTWAQQPGQEPGSALSLQGSVIRALENNVMAKLARERIEAAKGQRMQSRADLMPHLSMGVTQGRVFWDNAAAMGFPEFGILGPYNSFDARVQLTQRVFDLSAFSGFKAGDISWRISRLERDFVSQQVTLAAVFAYLNVLNNEERLRAVDEDIRLAGELVTLAEHQLSAGVVTELDVVRAKTRLAHQQAVRQDVLENLYATRFKLMRVVGAPLDSIVQLTDSMRYFPQDVLPVNDAVRTALAKRVEMSISKEKVRYQEEKLSEAKNDRLPKIDVYGNYGQSGITPTQDEHKVAAVGVKMTVTPFEGGDIAGRIRESRSNRQSEVLKKDDLQVQIEEDVRLSLQTLLTSNDRVLAAQDALDLAKREVDLAQKQYNTGVENNIAVVQAQDVLAGAKETAIAALMQYHLSRINYFSALGRTEEFYLNPSTDEGRDNGL